MAAVMSCENALLNGAEYDMKHYADRGGSHQCHPHSVIVNFFSFVTFRSPSDRFNCFIILKLPLTSLFFL